MLDETLDKSLHRLLDLFLEENTKLNLSAFRSEEDCWNGNVLDSLAALELPFLQGLKTPSSPTLHTTSIPQETGNTSIPQPLPPLEEGGVGKEKKYKPRNLLFYAREMRKEPTEFESILWEQIRHDQLGIRFRRQYIFEGAIFDFFCPKHRLAVEVDGEIHAGAERQKEDSERDEFFLNEHQILTLRFSNSDVKENIISVLETIKKHIQKHSPPPLEEGLGVEVEMQQKQEGLGVEADPGEQSKKILDLGTGGGFPLLPLALSLPAVRHFGLDSTQKKIDAVQRIIDAMNIPNVTLLCGRAEELGRDPQHREQYDIVTVRGLAALNTLLEYASSFVKPGGYIICWKSMKIEQELKDSLLARAELSCQLKTQHRYSLPEKWGERQLLVFVKRGPLNTKYPRAVGMPKKKPLL